MSEHPEQQNVEIEVQITWPPDTYTDAEPANAFVFTDLGENMCFAFGFVPPPPLFDRIAGEQGSLTIEAHKRRAFLLPKSVVVNLATQLQRLITNNAKLFPITEDSPLGGKADAASD